MLLVKENQDTLYRDIQLLFDPPPTVPVAPLTDRRVAHTVESGHGRSRERRELVASTDLADYLAWPGAAQSFAWSGPGASTAKPSGRCATGSPASPRSRPMPTGR